MGYDLHITKNINWVDDTKKIDIGAWRSLVKSDPSLEMVGFVEAATPEGKTIRLENPDTAVWVDPKTDKKHYFYFFNGEISVKNPTESAIFKMKEVAKKLDCKVQGDEGEDY